MKAHLEKAKNSAVSFYQDVVKPICKRGKEDTVEVLQILYFQYMNEHIVLQVLLGIMLLQAAICLVLGLFSVLFNQLVFVVAFLLIRYLGNQVTELQDKIRELEGSKTSE